jgi:hypothetical protein
MLRTRYTGAALTLPRPTFGIACLLAGTAHGTTLAGPAAASKKRNELLLYTGAALTLPHPTSGIACLLAGAAHGTILTGPAAAC